MKKLLTISALLWAIHAVTATAQSTETAYVGDTTRVAIGGDSENIIRAEILQVIAETERSSWLAEAWAGQDAGGLQLDYHWLLGEDKPKAVLKTFTAFDQNEYQDSKATIGLGFENPNVFVDAYVSRRLSGRRSHERSVSMYQRAYDNGIGVRIGHYFAQRQIRLQTGLDFETGKDENRQYTWSVGFEKFFNNTPHSIAINTAFNRKTGTYVPRADKHDAQIMAVWRYSFGKKHHRPKKQYRKVKVVETVPAPVTTTTKKKLVKHTASMRSDTFFGLDSDQLIPQGIKALQETAAQIKQQAFISHIKITGHTCDRGATDYNQTLSEKRALAVKNFFALQGIALKTMLTSGEGELNPKYPNDKESNRAKNRRVEIEFVTEIEQNVPLETQQPATIEKVRWVQEEIDSEPLWLRRALRHPVSHKQSISSYVVPSHLTAPLPTEVPTSTPEPIGEGTPDDGNGDDANQAPTANDDRIVTYTLKPVDIDVLANDNDPENDALTIIEVTSGKFGIVTTDGLIATYDPDEKFIDDLFTYTISDGQGNQAQGTVVVIDP